MHAVVNTMTLSEPMPDDVVTRMQSELMAQAKEVPGFVNAYCVAPDESTLIMVVVCDSEEAAVALHHDVGTPWIGANVRPYVETFDRKVGPVVAGM